MMNKENENTTTQKPEDNIFKLKGYLKRFWKDFLDLEHGVDKRLTIDEIKNKKSMSGPNAWMLMCSIVIASVGLNMNSPAVIIGAMLISPLMSPILGMGLAVGINDKETLKKSLVHFGMAVFIALATSSLYFAISPIKELTPEIASRTIPTPLDIFIAFFGGIAGIVSIARKDISTTLPGVAIATALMPPVCVAGYGIAMGRIEITLAALFLFFINTVFVSFATYLIVRFVLHFPQRDFANKFEKRKNTYYIAAFLFTIAVVSYFPFRKLLNDNRTNKKIELFKTEVFGQDKTLLDDAILTSKGDSSVLFLKVYGDGKKFMKEDEYASLLEEIGLEKTSIQIIPTTNINKQDISELDSKIKGIKDLTEQVTIMNTQKSEAELRIEALENELGTFRLDEERFDILTNIIKGINEEIVGVSYGKGQSKLNGENTSILPLIIVHWNKKTSNHKEFSKQIYNITKSHLNVEDIEIAHSFQ